MCVQKEKMQPLLWCSPGFENTTMLFHVKGHKRWPSYLAFFPQDGPTEFVTCSTVAYARSFKTFRQIGGAWSDR